jgi:hypothetical protein
MARKLAILCIQAVILMSVALSRPAAAGTKNPSLSGTLVVAVPVKEGMVACSDKRIFNHKTNTFNDDFVKIRRVNNNAFFVATNTVGLLDRATGEIAFDVFEITEKYVSQNNFVAEKRFWDGLSSEIRQQLLAYLAKRKFEEWPETDHENERLLFNLVFYSIVGKTVRSYSLKVFYEKARTPVIYIPPVASEQVKTPKLSGKGKDVMAYLARDPSLSQDPSILRFDQGSFDINETTIRDAILFAEKLFVLTNTKLPQARVSKTYDCALLSYENGFQWIDDSGRPAK